MNRVGGWDQIAANAVAETKYEINCTHGRHLAVFHHITGSTGGFVSLKMASAPRMATHEPDRADTQTVTTATRSTTVVTVTVASTTGMKAGDKVVLKNVVGDIEYNGTFDIASVPGGGVTFTYTHGTSGTDTSGVNGTVQHIRHAAHPATGTDGPAGFGIQTSDSTASYYCVYRDVSEYVELTLDFGGGVHSIWVQVLAS